MRRGLKLALLGTVFVATLPMAAQALPVRTVTSAEVVPFGPYTFDTSGNTGPGAYMGHGSNSYAFRYGTPPAHWGDVGSGEYCGSEGGGYCGYLSDYIENEDGSTTYRQWYGDQDYSSSGNNAYQDFSGKVIFNANSYGETDYYEGNDSSQTYDEYGGFVGSTYDDIYGDAPEIDTSSFMELVADGINLSPDPKSFVLNFSIPNASLDLYGCYGGE
ncbi:MAG: hypothetical protein SFV21_07800, partial [Rhodospirillaceae bacterium]|nr:hypothetical protein [Rhodospirillaceae bacterium]